MGWHNVVEIGLIDSDRSLRSATHRVVGKCVGFFDLDGLTIQSICHTVFPHILSMQTILI